MKVVINQQCYSELSLSEKAVERLRELNCPHGDRYDKCPRHDPALVQVIEEFGLEASADYARLVVEEFDDKYMGCYRVREYDGYEWLEVDWERICEKAAEDLTSENAATWKEKLQIMRTGRSQ